MPIEYVTREQEMSATKTRRIRFTRNTCEGGVDYGPDYERDEVELNAYRAGVYVSEGRAVYIEDEHVRAPAPEEQPAPKAGEKPAPPAQRPRG